MTTPLPAADHLSVHVAPAGGVGRVRSEGGARR